jgi:hypothetical protein
MQNEGEGALDEYALEQVRKGRLMLWIAMAGSIVLLPALFSSKLIALFFVAWVASFFGGLGGIREVARATNGSALLMYGSLLLVFMPLLNVAPIGLYLLIARGALRAAEEPQPPPARPRGPAPQARVPATPAAPAIRTGAAHELSGAIAYVKQAGIGRPPDVGGEIPEGSRLRFEARLPDGVTLPPESEPILRATHGVFAVVYLLDQGDQYTWANMGQLARAGIDLEELHRIGVANLQRRTAGNPGLRLNQGDGAHMLTMGGEFEASLVLVDALWDGMLREYAPNGPIVTIPARDMCVFCDARSLEGLKRVRTVATQPLADPKYSLTQKLFARRDGRWRVWPPEKPKDLAPLEFKL